MEIGDRTKLRGLPAKELDFHIARAESLRRQAVDAAFATLGRWIKGLLLRMLRGLWTSEKVRPTCAE